MIYYEKVSQMLMYIWTTWNLIGMQIVIDVGWGLQVCISDKLPSEPDAAGPQITLWIENSHTVIQNTDS